MNIRTRVGEDRVRSGCRGAGVLLRVVGDPDGGVVVERRWSRLAAELSAVTNLLTLLFGGSGNIDPGAVHVHFAIANLVEPSPGEKGSARWCVTGNGEVIAGSQGAASNDTLDDAESLAVVVGKRDLARSAEVSSAACDCDVVCCASLEGSGCAEGALVLVTFAWEVRAICVEGTGV